MDRNGVLRKTMRRLWLLFRFCAFFKFYFQFVGKIIELQTYIYCGFQVLTELQRLPNHLHSSKIGQYANWDMVSVLLATSSEIYR